VTAARGTTEPITQLKGSELAQLRILVDWRINVLLRMGHRDDSAAVAKLRDLRAKLR
jgi:hypothetical protein